MKIAPVEKPQHRGYFRKLLGKEYFILLRKLKWIKQSHCFAKVEQSTNYKYLCIEHQSILLRPLKDVDMYLQHNKIANLRLAAEKINGVTIHPGQTFSLWNLVGRPTKNKGYLEGLTLENGKTGKGIGGGLCQLGNLLYWMSIHTPLVIKERWRHGYDVFPDINRSIPFGCGATLSYNYIDLQIENTSEQSFRIEIWLDDTYLRGKITSEEASKIQYQIKEEEHHFTQQWWGGYTRHNKIYKVAMYDDGSTSKELLAENNAIMMYNPMLEA
jgi:vancomycin resistance protein VanW